MQRDRLIPYFNSKRFVFMVGGWYDVAENLENDECACAEAVIEECVKELTKRGVDDLIADKERVRSALRFIGKENMELLYVIHSLKFIHTNRIEICAKPNITLACFRERMLLGIVGQT